MTTLKSFNVSAIRNGTVIDHIAKGSALKIIELLGLNQHEKQVYLGLNLASGTQYEKDLIKIEDWELSEDEANQVAIFAPNATVNIISEYEVAKKFKITLPDTISGIVKCPNNRCITNHETVSSFFLVKKHKNLVSLGCHYCRKTYKLNELKL
jgi:aspartate carbamoyltransferase regulatory subunit